MAKPSLALIQVIQNAAKKLASSPHYQWGHMGACNCGYLAQEVTTLTKEEIHKRAMMRHGDWSEQLNDYCLTSGLPMDDLIFKLVAFGFDIDDLKFLERLADPEILKTLPLQERNLQFNVKEDAVKYMQAWSAKLEEDLLKDIKFPDLENEFNQKVIPTKQVFSFSHSK